HFRAATLASRGAEGGGMARGSKQLSDLQAQNEALRAQLADYRDAVEHMHQALCVYDDAGRIVVCNRRYAEILRLPPEAVRPGVTGRDVIRLGIEAGHYPPGRTVEELQEDIRASFDAGGGETGRMVRD